MFVTKIQQMKSKWQWLANQWQFQRNIWQIQLDVHRLRLVAQGTWVVLTPISFYKNDTFFSSGLKAKKQNDPFNDMLNFCHKNDPFKEKLKIRHKNDTFNEMTLINIMFMFSGDKVLKTWSIERNEVNGSLLRALGSHSTKCLNKIPTK